MFSMGMGNGRRRGVFEKPLPLLRGHLLCYPEPMPDYQNMSWLEALRYAKDVSGLTAEEIATRMGVKPSIVRRYLQHAEGYAPGLDRLPALCAALGNTGKKALGMKLAYIEAFNRMEEELARQKEAARNITQDIVDFPGTLSITPSTTEDRKPLRALVGSWAQVSGLPFAACWNQLKAAFQLTSIRDLPQEWIPDALAWVQARIDALPKALPPQPERLPLYRNGAFHLPPANNPAHKPGPQEEALMALWKEWGSRTRELEQLFNSLSRDLDACRGKTFVYAISDLGRHADTAFSTDAMLEGLHASQDTACDLFRQALHSMSRQLLLSLNVAVAMGR